MTRAASRDTTIAVEIGRFSRQFMWPRMALRYHSLPCCSSAPRGDRCAAGQDAAPAINPDRCEQNKQCPSGEAEQDPDRDWHRNLLVKERAALLECSATAGMVQNARNRSRECHSNAFPQPRPLAEIAALLPTDERHWRKAMIGRRAVAMPCLAPAASLAIGTTARRQPAVVRAHLQ